MKTPLMFVHHAKVRIYRNGHHWRWTLTDLRELVASGQARNSVQAREAGAKAKHHYVSTCFPTLSRVQSLPRA